MAWKFDAARLSDDMKAQGFQTVDIDGSILFTSQIGNGNRRLTVTEFIEICVLIELQPDRYIVDVKEEETHG